MLSYYEYYEAFCTSKRVQLLKVLGGKERMKQQTNNEFFQG
jgi:hypothetical protein